MFTERQTIQYNGINIPSIINIPSNPYGAAVIVHGYGGCKEEQLGLAWRAAELGLATCAIDLHGHGENMLNLEQGIFSDVEAAVDYCRRFACQKLSHADTRLNFIEGALHSDIFFLEATLLIVINQLKEWFCLQ